MVLSWFTSLYTLRQLVAMHEMDGKRFSRYHELGQYVFGECPACDSLCGADLPLDLRMYRCETFVVADAMLDQQCNNVWGGASIRE